MLTHRQELALSNGRKLLEAVKAEDHFIINSTDGPVRLVIPEHSPLFKSEAERRQDYAKFQKSVIERLDRYEAMRETRKNEERYADPLGEGPNDAKKAREHARTHHPRPSVIEKLTAPPETVEEHLKRIGAYYWEKDGQIIIERDLLDRLEGRGKNHV